MPKSKYFRVVVEGATCDGRDVTRQQIQEMADSYSPQLYGARCNLEHLKSLSPDSTFRMYGDVDAAKAEEIADGPLKGKLALYALIDATDEMVELNKKRQKVYSSVEINPSFADTGKAYLMGLAFTDSPASLGTEMLQFCANSQVNPLATRKSNPACLFSEATETVIEFEDDAPVADTGNKFFSRIKALLSKGQHQFSAEATEIRKAVELVAQSQADTLDKIESFSQQQEKFADSTELKKVRDELATLTAKLEQQDSNFNQRPPAQGGNGVDQANLADC
ncbi:MULTISPECIES: GPO family capsid scaffolding protein [Erwiniaceae]|uniref:GPO family capsid scaffolding protein n=1 Tax=Enterobacter agglomerans TaxID=549 RepID=A0ACC5RRA1_ENTAG|nr:MULTISPECIES: GPO family capsid scaffolding protein [Erwiniaceae]MBD8169538.1 GPO family capsid scaffolding protein [Erwinia persicina]MBK4727195.1 GPO family capsid scaffolding protein [Pantoea agglomerans]